MLSQDELDRAARFRFRLDRDRFVNGRVSLRILLAREVGGTPSELSFSYNPEGKPYLDGGRGPCFNLSNSGGLAVVALARRSVGIDIEEVRPGFADDQIAERFFSVAEVAQLRALPDESQERAFFECWTRKEALLKAKGGGLSLPLDSFDVAFGPDRTPAVLRSDLDPDDPEEWNLSELSHLFPGYVGAVAYRVDDDPVVDCGVYRSDPEVS